jgi:hypothetical protein
MGMEWLNIARQLQSIAQAGLAFSDNKYDIDRYQQLKDIALGMFSEITDIKTEKLNSIFSAEKGYQTPKVDIRGVVFREEKILMVCGQYREDGLILVLLLFRLQQKKFWKKPDLVLNLSDCWLYWIKDLMRILRICFIFIKSLYFAAKKGEQ